MEDKMIAFLYRLSHGEVTFMWIVRILPPTAGLHPAMVLIGCVSVFVGLWV